MKLRAILTAGVLACLFSAEAAKPAGAATERDMKPFSYSEPARPENWPDFPPS